MTKNLRTVSFGAAYIIERKTNRMKKTLSFILAIVMILAILPVTVFATENPWETVDASGYAPEDFNTAGKRDLYVPSKWTISKKYFAISYTCTLKENAGKVTYKLNDAGKVVQDGSNNGCIGLVLGGGDGAGCVYLTYANPAVATSADAVKEKPCGKQLYFGPWWGSGVFFKGRVNYGISQSNVGEEYTILLYGSYEGTTLKVRAAINGIDFDAWGQEEFTVTNFNGKLGYATKLSGFAAEVRYLESDSPLTKYSLGHNYENNSLDNGYVGPVMGKWTKTGNTVKSNTANISSAGSYYQLGYSDNVEVSAKMTLGVEHGFLFGVDNRLADLSINENGDRYNLVDFVKATTTGLVNVGVEKNDKKWGGWIRVDDTELVKAGTKDQKADVRVRYNKGNVKVYVDDVLVIERNGGNYGGGFGLWSKSATAVFEDVKVNYILDEPAEGKRATGYYQTRGNDLRVILECSKEELKKYAECEIAVAFETANGTVTKTYKANVAYTGLDYGENNFYVAPDGYGLIGCEILGITGATSFTAKATLKLADGGTVEIPLGSGNIG